MHYQKYLQLCPLREYQKVKRNEARAALAQLKHLRLGYERYTEAQRSALDNAILYLNHLIECLKVKNIIGRKKDESY